MLYRNVLALLTFLVIGLATAMPVRADAIQLFSQAQLNPRAATASYPNITPGFGGALFNSPLNVRLGALTISFSGTSSNRQLLRVDQGVGFFGDYANGAKLIETVNGSGVATGPLTIDFNFGIGEFGLNAQNAFTEDGATSLFTFSLFNGSTLIRTFTRGGADSLGLFFLGARATAGDQFTRIVISGASSVTEPNSQNNFAVDQIQVVVPEPTTWVLLGTGLAGVVVARRRKRQVG